MKTDQCRSVMTIMDQVEGVDLHERKGGKFFFPMYVSKQVSETSIEALDLSPRPYNSLRRVGINSIGDLAEAAAGGDMLKRIRNCGTKSVREIQESLFVYQYGILSPERQAKFLKDVVEMNTIRRPDIE